MRREIKLVQTREITVVLPDDIEEQLEDCDVGTVEEWVVDRCKQPDGPEEYFDALIKVTNVEVKN